MDKQKEKKKWYKRWWAITLYVIIFFSAISSMSNTSNTNSYSSPVKQKTSNPAEQAANKEPDYQLELLNFKCFQQYDFYHIEGQVKNISDESLKSVAALGTTYTADGEFIKSEESLIDYNPILAGQTSPFKVLMTHNPAITDCTIEFKKLFGGSIPTKTN